MPVIKINDFGGRAPSQSARLIPENYAQVATNIKLDNGQLRALYDTFKVLDGIDWLVPKTAYQLGAAWLLWSTYVNVVKADISASDNRILFTGGSYAGIGAIPLLTNYAWAINEVTPPAGHYPTKTRRLGVTKPTTIPIVVTAGDGDAQVVDSVAYCYTFVTKTLGEESAPFTATAVYNVENGEHIVLHNFLVPNLADCGNEIEFIRLYRLSSTAAGSAEYQRVKARPGSLSATPTYNIPVGPITSLLYEIFDANDGTAPTLLNQDLGDPLETEGWDPPPNALEGLVRFSNGMYAGFIANKIYLNVPGYYYAFPSTGTKNYTVETAYNVMALGVLNDALVVGTAGNPEILSGTDPRAMQRSTLPYQQPCLSKRGLVSLPDAVMYPCPDGMFMLSSTGGDVVTGPGPGRPALISREDWNLYDLDAMISVYWNQKIYVFFEGGKTGFVYDFTRNYILDFSIDITVKHAFVDPVIDVLYVLGLKDGQDNPDRYGIYAWEGASYLSAASPPVASYLSAVWKSKIFEVPPTNFSAARVEGTFPGASPVTFKVYAGGVPKHTQTVSSIEAFRLPSGFMAQDWEIEVTFTAARISSLYLATSMSELAEV